MKKRLEDIYHRIQEAAASCGRQPDEVQLVAVSKTMPKEKVLEAIDAGITLFGENYVQEARDKCNALYTYPVSWHFIGHLQTNKAKFIPGQFQWLHTLHSLELASKLSSRLDTANENLNTLIQVNITEDARKHGLLPDAVDAFMDQLLVTAPVGLRLRGLMTIGQQNTDSDVLRKGFSNLRELKDRLASQYDLPDFDQLSMGMSGDYHEAIAEGATWVRIGSAIFGRRNP